MSTSHINTIETDELIDLLRRAIANPELIQDIGQGTGWGYNGDYDVIIDGWRLVFFSDCGEVDYVDNATAPDGRTWHYHIDPEFTTPGSWADSEPMDCLTDKEQNAIETLFEDWKPSDE